MARGAATGTALWVGVCVWVWVFWLSEAGAGEVFAGEGGVFGHELVAAFGCFLLDLFLGVCVCVCMSVGG
jgi:hypothetical protein